MNDDFRYMKFIHLHCGKETKIRVFLAVRISKFCFFTTVQIYEFHISKIITKKTCLYFHLI